MTKNTRSFCPAENTDSHGFIFFSAKNAKFLKNEEKNVPARKKSPRERFFLIANNSELEIHYLR